MNYLFTLLIGLLFVSNTSVICTCAPIENWKKATVAEFEYVDYVFIGDVISINENETEYKLIICEVLKGDLIVGQKINGVNPKSCNPVIDKNGQWLFFANNIEHDKLMQNECGLTNNLTEPIGIPPPPPPPNSGIDYKKYKKKWELESKKMIEKQIAIVRKLAK